MTEAKLTTIREQLVSETDHVQLSRPRRLKKNEDHISMSKLEWRLLTNSSPTFAT